MEWYIDVLKKYVVFEGRARRKEYWMFALFNFTIIVALSVVEALLEMPPFISLIYQLAVLLPSLAVSVRRLHDTNRSGWWMLLVLVPIVGPIVLLVFFALEGKPEENQHGVNPKMAAV